MTASLPELKTCSLNKKGSHRTAELREFHNPIRQGIRGGFSVPKWRLIFYKKVIILHLLLFKKWNEITGRLYCSFINLVAIWNFIFSTWTLFFPSNYDEWFWHLRENYCVSFNKILWSNFPIWQHFRAFILTKCRPIPNLKF